ncbi:ras-related protein Rab-20 isoform X2 [Pristis pectinata]|uniref:ras-related protein Rab-20 isoform X2 n=1 Tax=Pristis pectinata TaxID=685728 RepID=UPI00223D939A|nr:ras-related protein Rab-20 isoform X2 [Pristis pectinata]
MMKPDGKVVILGDVNVGREQFHGLGSMYCRGAAAVILTYDVTNRQSLWELEDRFLALTDSALPGCIFAVAGNKWDLTEECAQAEGEACPRAQRQVRREDAIHLYNQLLRYRMLEEGALPPAHTMCFETSAKSGHNVDLLFETVLETVVSGMASKPKEPSQTVDLRHSAKPEQSRATCCT